MCTAAFPDCWACADAQKQRSSSKPLAGSMVHAAGVLHLLGLSADTTLQEMLDSLQLNLCIPLCCLQPFSDATAPRLQAPTPLWGWMPQGRPMTPWPRLSSGGCCLLASTPARWAQVSSEQGASALARSLCCTWCRAAPAVAASTWGGF